MWKTAIKKSTPARYTPNMGPPEIITSKHVFLKINHAILTAMKTNKMIRNSKSSEISQEDMNLLESSSAVLKKCKALLDNETPILPDDID